MKHSTNIKLRPLLADLGMSQAQLAREAKVDVVTVSRWVNGHRKIPGLVWSYLDLKRQLRDMAQSIMRQLS